jgi:hypothetical protein
MIPPLSPDAAIGIEKRIRRIYRGTENKRER